MTEKTKQALQIGVLSTLSLAFGAGAGWATVQSKLSNTDDHFRQVDARFDQTDAHFRAIDQRLADIYCNTVPAQQRAGCR